MQRVEKLISGCRSKRRRAATGIASRIALSDGRAPQGDQMLNDRKQFSGVPFVPFDIETYARHVSDRSHYLLG
jgi:hypothetical protein